ncbi:hypothetical protein [Streptomyces violascens]|uniref:hypothetical protein n=1 Tax=Streptomyces violascens TaxID=67381 RepID=UPI0016721E95|nr:hypothetical protein [Streptomyces violascens]GGU38897.1 hypothetical protein GCM10010289_69720 [Streptomyces violascens]
MATTTVTVHAAPGRGRYTAEFSALPGRTFGPWDMPETIQQLRIAALLEPSEARDLVFDAALTGSATTTTG